MLQQSEIICKKFAQNIKSPKFEAINPEIEDKKAYSSIVGAYI